MEWKQIRATYERAFAAAKKHRGLTQKSVARAGGLKGQNAISKLLLNDSLGPSVETFIRAVEGLGIKPSSFFAQVERSQHALKPAADEEAAPHGGGGSLPAATEEAWEDLERAIGRSIVRALRVAQSREQTPNPRARRSTRRVRPRKDR